MILLCLGSSSHNSFVLSFIYNLKMRYSTHDMVMQQITGNRSCSAIVQEWFMGRGHERHVWSLSICTGDPAHGTDEGSVDPEVNFM